MMTTDTVSVVIVRRGARRGRWRIALRMIGGAVGTVLVSAVVIYAGLAIAPGDPVAQLLGGRATDEARAAKRAELGLDDPLVTRFVDWIVHAVQGDLGTSFTYKQDVVALIAPRMGTTVLLVLMAAVLVIVVGLGLGILGGVKRRARPVVAALVGLGIAVPSFVSASVLIGLFAVSWKLFPTYGTGSGLIDSIWHLVLPSVALAVSFGSYVAQMTAAAVAEESETEHVLTSRSRGVPEGFILRAHVLRNAALPVMTASGLAIAGLVAGTVIVEQVFSIDGIGALLVQSVISKDYPVVMAISLIIVVVFVTVTTLIDLVQVFLDPRTAEVRA